MWGSPARTCLAPWARGRSRSPLEDGVEGWRAQAVRMRRVAGLIQLCATPVSRVHSHPRAPCRRRSRLTQLVAAVHVLLPHLHVQLGPAPEAAAHEVGVEGVAPHRHVAVRRAVHLGLGWGWGMRVGSAAATRCRAPCCCYRGVGGLAPGRGLAAPLPPPSGARRPHLRLAAVVALHQLPCAPRVHAPLRGRGGRGAAGFKSGRRAAVRPRPAATQRERLRPAPPATPRDPAANPPPGAAPCRTRCDRQTPRRPAAGL
jgi:hypothetical protein